MASVFVILIGVLSLFMSFSIGSNDAANALATSYGSQAAPLYYLLIPGAVFEFVGAYWCSGRLAGTLVSRIITDVNTLPELTVNQMMLGASIAAFLFIMAGTIFAMPISGTHTVVGALIGAGIIGAGASNVGWKYLIRVVLSWFISPALAAALSFTIFFAVCYLTLGGRGIKPRDEEGFASQPGNQMTFASKLLALTLISGIGTTMVTLLVIVLASSSPHPFSSWGVLIILALSFIGGLLMCRVVLINTTISVGKE